MKLAFRVRDKHIRQGKRESIISCPLAHAIREQTGAHNVEVWGEDIIIEGAENSEIDGRYNGHDRIRRFVSQFDLQGRKGVKPRTFVIEKA